MVEKKNIIDPNYNYLQFWTKKSAEEIQKKIRKDIFFDISDSRFDPNEQGKKTVKNSFYRYILELNQYRKSYFYDPKNIVFSPIKFDDANVLLLEFQNKLNKIVIVKFNYNDANSRIYKTYQYQNKNWVEISTKEEYKF